MVHTGLGAGPNDSNLFGKLDPPTRASSFIQLFVYFQLRADVTVPLGLSAAVSFPGIISCLRGLSAAVSFPVTIRYLRGLSAVICIVSFLRTISCLRGVWGAALLAHHS